jgi:drug/metabolite transporter (DMT)-like permease
VSHLVLAGFLLGMVVVFGIGVAYAVARRAWADYYKTKGALPGLRRDAWAAVRALLNAAWVTAVVLLVLICWFIAERRRA